MANSLFVGNNDVDTPPESVDPYVNIWPGLRGLTWTTADGVVWDLLSGDDGVLLTPEGVTGLYMPPIDRYTTESAGVDGSSWRGSRVKEREVFWPILLYSDAGSQEWVTHDRAWWRGLQPEKVGTWTVIDPSGQPRSLRIRFTSDGGHSIRRDPSQAGWAAYGITFVAEDPWWSGVRVLRTFISTAAQDFFNTGAAPPFFISSSASISTATLPNDGDVEAWPVWTITGPTTSVTVGLSGKLISVPFTIAAGKALVIDTDPRSQTAWDADVVAGVVVRTTVERTGELGVTEFAPIPPLDSVALSLTMVGTGTITAAIVPRFFKAW